MNANRTYRNARNAFAATFAPAPAAAPVAPARRNYSGWVVAFIAVVGAAAMAAVYCL